MIWRCRHERFIDRYATVSFFPFDDKARDRKHRLRYSLKYDVDQFRAYDGHLDLIKGVVNYMRKISGRGFRLRIHNDAPPGSGVRLFFRVASDRRI